MAGTFIGHSGQGGGVKSVTNLWEKQGAILFLAGALFLIQKPLAAGHTI